MSNRRPPVKDWSDPLLRAIVGVAVVLAVGLGALYVFGSAGGILFAIPGIVQAVSLVLATEAVAIAFVAFSRYRVLPEPVPFWIGVAMSAFAVGFLFILLGFPYTPEGAAVIAQLPNTGSWLGYTANALFAIFLLVAARASWPRSRRLAEWWWLLAVIMTVIVVAAIQISLLVFERNLPLIVTEGGETRLRDYLYVPLVIMSGVGAMLFARRYRQSGDVLAGFTSLAELLLVAQYVSLIFSGARFDLAFYFILAFLFAAPTVLLFGLLSEYVTLFQREQEKRRELEVLREEAERQAEEAKYRAAEARHRAAELKATIDNMVDAVFVSDREECVTLANGTGLRLLGSNSLQAQPCNLARFFELLQVRHPDGKPFAYVHLPMVRALAGETVTQEDEIVLDRESQQDIYVRTSAASIRDDVGRIVGAVEVMRDISELRRLDLMKDDYGGCP